MDVLLSRVAVIDVHKVEVIESEVVAVVAEYDAFNFPQKYKSHPKCKIGKRRQRG
jgi:hypothetical protein